MSKVKESAGVRPFAIVTIPGPILSDISFGCVITALFSHCSHPLNVQITSDLCQHRFFLLFLLLNNVPILAFSDSREQIHLSIIVFLSEKKTKKIELRCVLLNSSDLATSRRIFLAVSKLVKIHIIRRDSIEVRVIMGVLDFDIGLQGSDNPWMTVSRQMMERIMLNTLENFGRKALLWKSSVRGAIRLNA